MFTVMLPHLKKMFFCFFRLRIFKQFAKMKVSILTYILPSSNHFIFNDALDVRSICIDSFKLNEF